MINYLVLNSGFNSLIDFHIEESIDVLIHNNERKIDDLLNKRKSIEKTVK